MVVLRGYAAGGLGQLVAGEALNILIAAGIGLGFAVLAVLAILAILHPASVEPEAE